MAKLPVVHKREGAPSQTHWGSYGYCRVWCRLPPNYYQNARNWKDVTCKRCWAQKGKR